MLYVSVPPIARFLTRGSVGVVSSYVCDGELFVELCLLIRYRRDGTPKIRIESLEVGVFRLLAPCTE